ncbi:MAG TPA: hypothetical protein VEW03_12770 [Longimicrobiaceae bacterium]|nr:hypothetical protein [Longimicrobiaceae bacterium]
MKQSSVAALLVLGLGASAPAYQGDPVLVSGHYRVDWEEQSFRACGRSERWWVSDPGDLMARYRDVVKDGDYGTVYATVRVELTEPGMYGHLGMYRRAAAVREVVEARAPRSGDCDGRRTIEAE